MSRTTAPLWTATSAAEELVREADVAHLAVRTAAGPHTTPVAVAWSGGKLWLLTPRRSAKARAARRHPVAALLHGRDGHLVLRGSARVLDAMDVRSVLRVDVLGLVPAASRYLRTQGAEALAVARDALELSARTCDLAPLAPRAVLALAPRQALLMDSGALGGDVQRWGDEPAPGARLARLVPRTAAPQLKDWAAGLRGELAEAGAGRRDAVLTIDLPDGPLPLPAVWHGRHGSVRVSPAVAALLPQGARRLAACVTVTVREEAGLRGKAGLLLRGTVDVPAGGRELRVAVERLTWWDGMRSGTVRHGQTRPGARRHVR